MGGGVQVLEVQHPAKPAVEAQRAMPWTRDQAAAQAAIFSLGGVRQAGADRRDQGGGVCPAGRRDGRVLPSP